MHRLPRGRSAARLRRSSVDLGGPTGEGDPRRGVCRRAVAGPRASRRPLPDRGGVIVLVLGGARSGKSAVAEAVAADLADGGPVTYLATGVGGVGDADFEARIAAHQARRPPWWTTVESAGDLAGSLE